MPEDEFFLPPSPKIYFGSRLVIVCLLMWLSVAMNKVRSPIYCGSFASELRTVKPASTYSNALFFLLYFIIFLFLLYFILFCSVIKRSDTYGMNWLTCESLGLFLLLQFVWDFCIQYLIVLHWRLVKNFPGSKLRVNVCEAFETFLSLSFC